MSPTKTLVSKDYGQVGRRLIPQIVDDLALHEPNRLVYSIAKSADISEGFMEVSARVWANAVNRTAWWLDGLVGKSDTFQTVGYVGPHDIRYFLLNLACIKAGYKALFVSSKNSRDAALAVLNATDCNIWVHPKGQPQYPIVQECLLVRPMRVLDLPEVEDLLLEEKMQDYPYTKTFDEAKTEPFCVLHTSGTTGLPKPIVWTNGLIATYDAVRLLPPTDGDYGLAPWATLFKQGDRLYNPSVICHGSGILMDLFATFLFGTHCIMGPAGITPDMELIGSLADHGNVDIWFFVPKYVNELGETPRILEKLHRSKFIAVGGGPVSPEIATEVNKVIRILNLIGVTEGLFIGNLVVDRDDFLSFAFHPWSGYEFREVEPGVYEQWIVRNEHWPLFQGFFHTPSFQEAQEINIKDLLTKHPTKPGHWLYKGRSDDIVGLADGIKLSPLGVEATVGAHPAVNGCLMVGYGKRRPALLVELKEPKPDDPKALENLMQSIGAQVKKAEKSFLHKGYLHTDYIILADPEKPLVRTDKLTIKRRDTLNLYIEEIERFYSQRGD